MSSLRPVSGDVAGILRLLREWDGEDAPAPLVIETSGSTGRPKRVVLSRAAMRASVDATHARLGGPGQWVLNLPPSYVAGVQVLFRSVRAGTDPVVQDGTVAEAAARMTGARRYVSLVPTQLVRLLDDEAETTALAEFDAVLVGGGPLDPAVRARAEAAGVPVVQTYGMSETCGGCVYDGRPLDGVEVEIDGGGQVLLGGPVLFDGYEDDPGRTADVLVDGRLRTNDLGELAPDGRLRILGRVDDVVISGGVKVPPPAVEQMLAAHPAVAEVCVVGLPDPEWGERVVAAVVPRGAGRPSLEELRGLVEPRSWAPRQVEVVDAVPLLANGKVDRRSLRARLEVAADD